MKISKFVLLVASSLLAAACAFPAVNAADATPADMTYQQILKPEVQQENGIDYVNGGVGIDGRAQLAPLGRDMDLQLVFAEKSSGALLADVDVAIADSSGKEVLKLEGADPMLYAQLPPGNYDVKATIDGKTVERKINVSASGQRMEVLQWG